MEANSINKIYQLSEQQPEEGKACVLWEDAGVHTQCMFYWGSWYKIDDSGNVPSYTYYRTARLTDHWAYVAIHYPVKDTDIEERDLCDRITELENKLKELEEIKTDIGILREQINDLEKRMILPITDPVKPYDPPYPYNPSIPWTYPPYSPTIYTTTCSVEVSQNR